MFKHLSTLLKIGLAIAIVVFLIYKASSNAEFTKIIQSPKRWELLFLGQILMISGISLSFIRWCGLVNAIGINFRYRDSLRIGFIGHMFGSISIGTFGSDAIRIYYVSRENPNQKAVALVSVFVDRLCGLLGLFTLTTITMLCFQYFGHSDILTSQSKTLQSITWIALGLTCAGLVGFASLFVLPYLQKNKFVQNLCQLKWFGPLFTKALEAGLVYKQRPSILIIALLQSIGVHVLLTLSVFCVACGLCVERPSFGDHFIISPISHLASVLPLPGGLGGLEGSMWFFYRSISQIPTNAIGLIVALAYRIEVLVAALIGVVFYVRGRRELNEWVEAERKQSEVDKESASPDTP